MKPKCIEAGCKVNTAMQCLTCGESVCQWHLEYFIDSRLIENYEVYFQMQYVDKCNQCFDEEKDEE